MPDTAHTPLKAGIQALQAGDAETAVKHLSIAMRTQPPDMAVYGYLGVGYGMCGKFEEAVFCFKQGLRLAPQSASLHHNLGQALEGLRRQREAIASCRQALVLDPGHEQAKQALLRVLPTSNSGVQPTPPLTDVPPVRIADLIQVWAFPLVRPEPLGSRFRQLGKCTSGNVCGNVT